MKITMTILLILTFISVAQTPFEFALVQELVQGSPRVSTIRIAIDYGAPEPGRTELEIAMRGAVTFCGEICIYPEGESYGNLLLTGDSDYTGEISGALTDRLFDALLNCLGDFPGMNITDLSLDMVSPDGMSWIALECRISRIDSLQNRQLNRTDFWKGVTLREIEISTAGFTPMYRSPAQIIQPVSIDTLSAIGTPIIYDTQPWKSLVLPGWGQISSGNGLGWINIIVEAGGAALIIAGETEVGWTVLGVNHIISFFDLF